MTISSALGMQILHIWADSNSLQKGAKISKKCVKIAYPFSLLGLLK